jgi:hypothetical protein
LKKFLSGALLVALAFLIAPWARRELQLEPPQAVTPFEPEPLPEAEPFTWEAQPALDEGFAPPESAPPLPADAALLNAQAVHAGNAGRHHEAVELLEQALELAPEHPALLRNLQATFFNWGAAELQSGDAQGAIGPLEESLRIGAAAETLKVLGSAYLQAREPESAAAVLEEAAGIAPSRPEILIMLAQAYIELGRRPDALDLLFRAREAGAPAGVVGGLIETLSREVDAEWDFNAEETAHFRLSFADEELPGTIDVVAAALEDAYRAVGAKLGSYPLERTQVVLYARQDFHRLTQTSGWAEGVFDGRIKVPVRGLVADDPQLARVLRHEYAHAVVAHLAGRRCPTWVSEGIAMWAEDDHDGERYSWAEGIVSQSGVVPLRRLEQSFSRLPAAQARLAYAQSYLAVQRLVQRHGSGRLRQLLAEIGNKRPLEQAFFDVYHQELHRFERDVFG